MIVAGTAGCASAARPAAGVAPSPSTLSPPAQPDTALPPRPATLRLNGVEPCALLAGPGARELNVQPGVPSGRPDLGNAQCYWANYLVRPNDNWLAEALLSTSAESVLSGSPDARVVQVDGFPAVQTDAPGTDPARACLLHVDVAPGQSLLVRYLEGTGDNPAMNHALACHKAQQAAEFMVNQLRTLGS